MLTIHIAENRLIEKSEIGSVEPMALDFYPEMCINECEIRPRLMFDMIERGKYWASVSKDKLDYHVITSNIFLLCGLLFAIRNDKIDPQKIKILYYPMEKNKGPKEIYLTQGDSFFMEYPNSYLEKIYRSLFFK